MPRGPVVKNPPSNAGDVGSVPSRETKIPHAAGQISQCAATTELVRLNKRAHVLQTIEPARHNYRAHVRWSPCATIRERKPARHN